MTPSRPSSVLFDLGLTGQAPVAGPALPPLSLADVLAPPWLDSNLMFYRLNYANAQQPQPYANSRWSMAPAQLFEQRLKARIVQAGGAVLLASDGAVGIPVLRLQMDDFSQVFDSPSSSAARVVVHAAAYQGRRLLGQKSFTRLMPASSPDANGGAAALAAASDAIASDMMAWLASLPLAAR